MPFCIASPFPKKRSHQSILSKRIRAESARRKQERRCCYLIIAFVSLVLVLQAIKPRRRFIMEEELNDLLSKAHPPVGASSASQVTKLNVPDVGLASLPASLCDGLPNLSILFAPNNNMKELPAMVGKCPNLQMVSFKTNGMTQIHPDALQGQLRWLILTDNALTSLPSTIGRCGRLQKLMLSGNRLSQLPSEIGNCKNLELVRLASNQLKVAPMALLSLPNLAWVALSANPFLDQVANTSATTILEIFDDPVLDDETHGEILGQGASGVTRKVFYKNDYVAVKTYKGTMTSDGSPLQEKQIALAASSTTTDCLVKVLGQTPKGSLVMELLHDVRAFGGPPSMESCSRDVYGDHEVVSEFQAKTMVAGLLEALVELHKLGIMHGDLYGHNILVSNSDPSLVKLSDFGAAFFYDTTAEYGALLQQIEMRAFGILVGEIDMLLARVDANSILRRVLKAMVEASRTKKSFVELQDLWKMESL